ncbi:N-acetylglucosaminyl-diphospho-decaprenol L-rhamnosyltransferase [Variovorax sp. PBS-H4]|uniref:glycosyltransferase family 2 protein n=1 Tax=Variovorax sp. PBS-H4 TaxID=434008 RepID=UPI00131923F6|nr:glycosyltransferase [Variovorax sp. PBS-H4]VTU21369.1 N-acetylglucosaminyl-diphospho-decaprenol L-rhamnosyltransferase [Variovorax sp. PBS-H4]
MSKIVILGQSDREGFHSILTSANGVISQKEAKKFSVGIPTDEWLVIGPRKTELHPHVWDILAQATHQRPDVGIFYGDDVALDAHSDTWEAALKPDWDFTLLLASDYVGLPLFIRSAAAKQLGYIDGEQGTAASYDLLLRARATGITIARIPEVLAKIGTQRVRAALEDRVSAIKAWSASTSDLPIDVLPGLKPETLRVDRHLSDLPEVTLVVPTRQTASGSEVNGRVPFVIKFLESLTSSIYPMDRIHVLLGDDVESDDIYVGRQWPFRLRRMVTRRADGEPFNYAAKMNQLWRESTTEYVILMNDDITIRSSDWIQALLTFSTQNDVGGVGARLLYPTGEIQHAGMPGGVFGLVTHAWIGEPSSASTYQDWASVHREWSMVTGAVFATRKSLLEEVNGFDERFRLDFNDIDLCLKLRMLGYRIVYTPHAELVHHEKGSRGEASWPASELALFLSRWGRFLEDDPSFHPKLSKIHHKIQPVEFRNEWWQVDA